MSVTVAVLADLLETDQAHVAALACQLAVRGGEPLAPGTFADPLNGISPDAVLTREAAAKIVTRIREWQAESRG